MKKLFVLLAVLTYTVSFSQMPAYYNGIDFTQSSTSIKTQLSALVTSTHVELPYTSTSTDTWDVLKQSDVNLSSTSNVLLTYGWNDTDAIVSNDRNRNVDLSCHTSSCSGLWVREHVFPRSLGNPNLGFAGPGSDCHNLRAIDNDMNNQRSNNQFFSGSSQQASLSSSGFYPGDEWRGDVARQIMYMHLRWTIQCMPNVVANSANTYHVDMPDLFLLWNVIDPVSDFERHRNNIIHQYQGNRNPFIDNPYIATIIWSGPAAEDTWQTLSSESFSQDDAKPIFDECSITNADKFQTIVIFDILGRQVNNVCSTGIYIVKYQVNDSIRTIKIAK